ncbi:MAG: CARDB domain-containing protein [Patescibacteria group bacterium]
MRKKLFLLKIGVILLGCLVAAFFVFEFVLSGGNFIKKSSTTPPRARFAANDIKKDTPNVNLKVKKLEVSSKEADGFFRMGKPINVECSIENNSEKTAYEFVSLARTPRIEINSKYLKELGPNKEITLSGSFTPETTGTILIACRADSSFKIAESNENDNREIFAVYVVE